MTDVEAIEEMTDSEREQLAAQAHELDQTIRDGIAAGRRALWDVARALYEFDEIAGWISLGAESKTEWLADPEIGMSSATYYQLVRLHRSLVVNRKIDSKRLENLDTSKVRLVLPRVEMGKIKLDEALDDAEALGWRDLRDKYRIKPKPPADTEGDTEEDIDEDEIDGYPVVDADAVDVEPPMPSDEMWQEIVERAKKSRQNLIKTIEKHTDWVRFGDGDGTNQEDWALPEVVGDPEGTAGAEATQGATEGSEALRTPENGSGDRAAIDRAKVLAQAEKDWEALRDELVSAAESGQANPRVNAKLIRAGVQGATLLIERASDERSEDE